MRLIAVVLVSALAAECPAKLSPRPVGDAAPDGGSCAAACETLRGLGCPEGRAPNCVEVCNHAEATRLTELHPGCLTAATSKAAVRACGGVACAE